MASQNVVLRFVTSYVGKGMDLFKAAMSSTGRIVARSVSGMGKALESMLSGTQSQIGKFARQLGDLGTMLAQGGIWGAATFAVTKLFETIKHQMDAGKRHLERFADSFKASMSRAVDAAAAKFKAFTAGIERAVVLSRALLGFRNAGDSADASGAVAGVNAKEREALAKASDDSERAVISANAAQGKEGVNG